MWGSQAVSWDLLSYSLYSKTFKWPLNPLNLRNGGFTITSYLPKSAFLSLFYLSVSFSLCVSLSLLPPLLPYNIIFSPFLFSFFTFLIFDNEFVLCAINLTPHRKAQNLSILSKNCQLNNNKISIVKHTNHGVGEMNQPLKMLWHLQRIGVLFLTSRSSFSQLLVTPAAGAWLILWNSKCNCTYMHTPAHKHTSIIIMKSKINKNVKYLNEII